MSNIVILPSEFKIKNVSFNPPKKNAVGGQSVLLSYYNETTGNKGPLIIQTPKCKMPFGPDITENDGKITRYSINYGLADNESKNENLVQFTDIIKMIDEKVKKEALTECADEWFGKTHSEEMISEMYKSAIKRSKGDKYPPTFKIKLPVKINNDKLIPLFDIYDDKREKMEILNNNVIDISCLEKGAEACSIIQCTGIWWVGTTQFGVGYKVIQSKIYPTQKLVGYSIVDDEEEQIEDEDEEN